jgi:hypothetical protein
MELPEFDQTSLQNIGDPHRSLLLLFRLASLESPHELCSTRRCNCTALLLFVIRPISEEVSDNNPALTFRHPRNFFRHQ